MKLHKGRIIKCFTALFCFVFVVVNDILSRNYSGKTGASGMLNMLFEGQKKKEEEMCILSGEVIYSHCAHH